MLSFFQVTISDDEDPEKTNNDKHRRKKAAKERSEAYFASLPDITRLSEIITFKDAMRRVQKMGDCLGITKHPYVIRERAMAGLTLFLMGEEWVSELPPGTKFAQAKRWYPKHEESMIAFEKPESQAYLYWAVKVGIHGALPDWLRCRRPPFPGVEPIPKFPWPPLVTPPVVQDEVDDIGEYFRSLRIVEELPIEIVLPIEEDPEYQRVFNRFVDFCNQVQGKFPGMSYREACEWARSRLE